MVHIPLHLKKSEQGLHNGPIALLILPAFQWRIFDKDHDRCVVRIPRLLTHQTYLYSFRADVDRGTIKILAKNWPFFFYDLDLIDAKKKWLGLFRGEILFRVTCSSVGLNNATDLSQTRWEYKYYSDEQLPLHGLLASEGQSPYGAQTAKATPPSTGLTA